MRTGLRRLALFGPPLLVAAFEMRHPIAHAPIYPSVAAHMPWWLTLHVANLALFPLLGLAAWTLLKGVQNRAATFSRVAIGVFIPLYTAFDALAGVATGVLARSVSQMPPAQRIAAEPLLDAYWADGNSGNGVIYRLAAVSSIAWVVAMLAAAVALTDTRRRNAAAVAAIVLFAVGGWARTNIFMKPDMMTIRPEWWLVTLGMAVLMFLVARPHIPAALLVLAGALFGAFHPPPTGPLGAICFLAAAAYWEFARNRAQEPVVRIAA
jgi:hypothetical protein